MNKNKSVCFALIHNNNVLRNAYIRPQMLKLLEGLAPCIVAEKTEVSFQPEIKPHSIAMVLMRDAMYRVLVREWFRYLQLKPRTTLLRDIASFLKESFIRYIVDRDGIRARRKKSSAIEVIVTEKHLRAWGGFLDTDAEFLICFEDDAVFKEDSAQKINNLLIALFENSSNTSCYIDLGGGVSLNDLSINHLEVKQDEFYRHYSKPVTNTACAYLMSRQLVATFHSILTRKPWLRLNAIDWLMNSLFIEMLKEGEGCVCMHANPTIVKHGTTTGEYVSWQATAQHQTSKGC